MTQGRVVTVTPNPALDLTYRVHGITPGGSHRVQAPLSRAGGKGLNVARVIHQLGHPVLAIAPCGGDTGALFSAELRGSGVPHRLVPVAAETRRSIAMVDTASGDTTIFNEEGHPLEPGDWRAVVGAVVDALGPDGGSGVAGGSGPDGGSGVAGGAGVLVGSGSLPPAAPQDFFPALVRFAHDAGIPAVVDTSGTGIIAAAKAGADLLKPNNHELAEATGENDPAAGARALLGLGARLVLVSAGAAGMMAFHREAPGGYFTARLPQALDGNPTGAGDAAVAAAAVALASGIRDARQILRKATAWSAAAVLMPAAGEVSPRLPELEEQLVITWKESQ